MLDQFLFYRNEKVVACVLVSYYLIFHSLENVKKL